MLARPASRMAVGSEVRYVSENQEGRMHPLKKAWAAVTVLGGLAVVGSYVWGLASIPNASTDFWGGTPEALIPLYTVSVLLGAVSFFFITAFVCTRPSSARSNSARAGST